MGNSSSNDAKLGMSSSAFDYLLSWLHYDRDQAAQKYESIRSSLVKIFTWERCPDPESLADEVIDRVAAKVPDIVASYTGDPSLYFYGVAKRILLERRRIDARSEVATQVNPYKNIQEEEEHKHKLLSCLENCFKHLPRSSANCYYAIIANRVRWKRGNSLLRN